MLAKSLQKLSKSTAVAALGVAIVAAAGAAPASAANVKEFNLNVSLGSSATAQGTYKVDVDLLPTQSQVLLNDWNIDLKDNLGNLIKSYSKSAGANQIGGIFGQNLKLSLPGTTGFVDALVFIDADIPNNNFSQLFLPFSAGFTGEGTPLAGSYLAQANPGIVASAVSGGSTAVPEPITLAGTAVAGVMAAWMKRKQKASKAA